MLISKQSAFFSFNFENNSLVSHRLQNTGTGFDLADQQKQEIVLDFLFRSS